MLPEVELRPFDATRFPQPGAMNFVVMDTREEPVRQAVTRLDPAINGYRFAIGGAHAALPVDVDLATFGKGMANGTPLSAIVGRREVMRCFEKTFCSLTFGGETLGLTAAMEVLAIYREERVIEALHEVGRTLHRAALAESGLGGFVSLTPHPARTIVQFQSPYRSRPPS